MTTATQPTNSRRDYELAAIRLAAYVDVDDRLATDPTTPGDRSARANSLRAEQRAEALAAYRVARHAFLEASI